MRDIKRIVVHCSDSDWGDRNAIDLWHKQRGWKGIGYHYIILNGRRVAGSLYRQEDDGAVEFGRPIDEMGAHVKGQNEDTVGICLIGKHHFTGGQLLAALPGLLMDLMKRFGLCPADVYGHHELDLHKTCPNINMDNVRSFLVDKIRVMNP